MAETTTQTKKTSFVSLNMELQHFSLETLAAMQEARRISRDPGVKGYRSMEELNAALENSEPAPQAALYDKNFHLCG